MDVTPAVQPQPAPAGVVTYNQCRLYVRPAKWTKMPGQQKKKMVKKRKASLAERSQHALQ